MDVFGLLLWTANLLAIGGILMMTVYINGRSKEGWGRTNKFYLITSLFTMPLAMLLWHTRSSSILHLPMPIMLICLLRLQVCLPLSIVGCLLAIRSFIRNQPDWQYLLMVAILNAGIFIGFNFLSY